MRRAANALRRGLRAGGKPSARTAILLMLALGGMLQLTAALWIPAKAALAEVLIERAWVRAADGGPAARPWPWADTRPVAKVSAPDRGIAWTVLDGADGATLAFGPGRMHGTDALGTGRPGAVTVVGGHRDTQFAALGRLTIGDRLTVETPEGRLRHYRIVGSRVTAVPEAAIRPEHDTDVLVLVTCWPLNALTRGPERLLVRAVGVEAEAGAAARRALAAP